MDDDKSLLEKLTDTVKHAAHVVAEGAKAIAHPTSGTPMDMPLNESGYALTHPHPHFTPTPTADKVKKTAKEPAKKAAKKSAKKTVTKLTTNKSKKAVKKAAKKSAKKAEEKEGKKIETLVAPI
jgi:hypothetical protein